MFYISLIWKPSFYLCRLCFRLYLAMTIKYKTKIQTFPQKFFHSSYFFDLCPGPLYLPGSLILYSFLRFFVSCWNEMRVWIYFIATLSQLCFCWANIFYIRWKCVLIFVFKYVRVASFLTFNIPFVFYSLHRNEDSANSLYILNLPFIEVN